MTKRIFLALAALTLSTSLLSADDGDGDRNGIALTPAQQAQQVARSVARLTIRLTLTTAQQAQATTIFTAELAAEAALVAPRQAAQTALQAAIQVNSVSGIQAQAAALGAIQTQQIVADATADASFYAILTPAQQTTYNNYKLADRD